MHPSHRLLSGIILFLYDVVYQYHVHRRYVEGDALDDTSKL